MMTPVSNSVSSQTAQDLSGQYCDAEKALLFVQDSCNGGSNIRYNGAIRSFELFSFSGGSAYTMQVEKLVALCEEQIKSPRVFTLGSAEAVLKTMKGKLEELQEQRSEAGIAHASKQDSVGALAKRFLCSATRVVKDAAAHAYLVHTRESATSLIGRIDEVLKKGSFPVRQ